MSVYTNFIIHLIAGAALLHSLIQLLDYIRRHQEYNVHRQVIPNIP